MQHVGPFLLLFLLPLVMCLQEQTSRLPNYSPQVTLCRQYSDTGSLCNHCLSTVKTNYNYCCLDLLVRTTCQLCHKDFNNCHLLVEIIKTLADSSILIPIKQNSTYNKMLPLGEQQKLVQRIILQLSVATVPATWTSIGRAINRLIESKNVSRGNKNIVLHSSKQSLAAVKPRSREINTLEKVVDFPEDVSSELKQLTFISQFVNSSWILFPALQIYTQHETLQGLKPEMKTPLTNTDSGLQTLQEVIKASSHSQSHPFVMNNPESKKFITKGNKLKMESITPKPQLVDREKSSWQATGNSKSVVARNLRSINENNKTDVRHDTTRGGQHLGHDLDVNNSRETEPRIHQEKKWGSLGAGKFRRWWFGKVST